MNYSHLYNTNIYTPSSVTRKMQEARSTNSSFGMSRVNGNQAVGGVNSMNYLVSRKLQNKDVYSNMKNKTVYSMKSSITAHSSLNSL